VVIFSGGFYCQLTYEMVVSEGVKSGAKKGVAVGGGTGVSVGVRV
jgi:hypothetical protein